MEKDYSQLIAYDRAVDLVGEAKFGDDYISELTFFEAWLLWNAGIIENSPSLQEGVGVGESPTKEIPRSRIAAAEQFPETRAALYKWQFMQWQRENIATWFETREIDTGEGTIFDSVDKQLFDKKFSTWFIGFKPKSPPTPPAISDTRRLEREAHERQGGRPRKWDWDGALVELIRLANTPDGLPQVQADIERHVADWFSSKFGDHPAESKIREKVAAVMRALPRPETPQSS